MKKHSSMALAGGLGVVSLSVLALGLVNFDSDTAGESGSAAPFASVLRVAQAQVATPQEGDPAAGEAAASQEASVSESGQPIDFPHDTHAGAYQIDCQYCHFSAERSMSAGIPPVASCMGCHNLVAGSQNPDEVTKLRGYAERQEAIPWNRVYRVADHVQFPHMRHVAAGVNCTTCHGNVPEIGVIQQVAQPLTMGWCINCHIDSGASRDCTVCHY